MPNDTSGSIQTQGSSLFIGLQSYNEAQANMFFGRDEEIERLTTLVKVNALTIVFGRSGTGKTSLLNAGVFPLLRKNYCLPFRIRLEFQDDSPDLVTQIKNVLKSEIDKYGFRVDNYPGKETLWEYFHKEFLWKSITPILVFDQFEEIFTLAKKNLNFANDKLDNFWEELSDLIENKIPKSLQDAFINNRDQITYDHKQQPVKVIFAFREEFLPEFESIPFKIPSLKYSRFRLMPMNQKQAYEVVTKTWGDKINDQQANKIITYMTNDEKLVSISDIEPSLLSQVCFYLDKERIAQGNEKITSEFLDKYPKETILRSIYDEVLSESYDAVGRPPAKDGKVPGVNPVKVFVEDKLITNEGYRTKYALTEHDENIRPGIEVLKTKYFVRDDGKAVELTHDVLAPIIKVDREKRRKKIALAEAKKRAGKIALFIILLALLTGGAFWAYATYKRNIAQAAEAKASNHKDSLDRQILVLRNDSTTLAENNKKARDDNGKTSQGSTAVTPVANAATIDSIQGLLTISDDQIASLKINIGQLNSQIDELKTTNTNLSSDNESMKGSNAGLLKKIDELSRQIADDNDLLAKWKSSFEKLQKEYYDYKISHPSTNPGAIQGGKSGPGDSPGNNGTVTNASDLDSNSLKVNLHSSYGRVPDNLTIFIIPYTPANKNIIRDAKLYQIYCDDNTLINAEGSRIAKYSNGYYYFPKLPANKYLIKICTYYGGYYIYEKKSPGTEILKWDVAPPIR